jgi:hypothetical protein
MGTNVTWEHVASISSVKLYAPGPSKATVKVSNKLHAITSYKNVICTWQQHKILNSGVCGNQQKNVAWMDIHITSYKQQKMWSHIPKTIWIPINILTGCLNYNLLCILNQRLYFPHHCYTSNHLYNFKRVVRGTEKYYISISWEFWRLYTHHFNKTCILL